MALICGGSLVLQIGVLVRPIIFHGKYIDYKMTTVNTLDIESIKFKN
jgi:hypothetical protein